MTLFLMNDIAFAVMARIGGLAFFGCYVYGMTFSLCLDRFSFSFFMPGVPFSLTPGTCGRRWMKGEVGIELVGRWRGRAGGRKKN